MRKPMIAPHNLYPSGVNEDALSLGDGLNWELSLGGDFDLDIDIALDAEGLGYGRSEAGCGRGLVGTAVWQTDANALRKVWLTVGRYMQDAIGEFAAPASGQTALDK